MFVLIVVAIATGDFIQVGQTNVIDDPSNPSHGLAYLDVDVSVGDTLPVALSQAGDGWRLATLDEFDDLFSAAGAIYDSEETASSGFKSGGLVTLYDVNGPGPSDVLIDVLGSTQSIDMAESLFLWTDPANDMTRDIINATVWQDGRNTSVISNSAFDPGHNFDAYVGWLLVKDRVLPAFRQQRLSVPEPSALFLVGVISLLLFAQRKISRCL